MAKKFVFRRNQIIGATAAESDDYFLSRCFIDTGDLDILRNCNDPRNLLIGRTGTGKSALLTRLVDVEDHVIQISPEALSLSFISNSNILRFFSDVGVKMDIFYRLLWRHILCVEVLKERFNIVTEEKKKSFLDKLWSLIPKDKKHEQALDYLRKWGESFWKETEYRVKEVTTKLEHELEGAVEGKIPNIGSLSASAAKKLTEEQKEDVIYRAQEVVNKVQIRELSSVIKLIDEVLLSDRQKKYFVTIDKLDEDWIEDDLRYRLIRALIETSVEFTRIPNLKIIVAIRSDLLDRVYRFTRDTGFQEEKYKTSSLNIIWNKSQLIEIFDTRINTLIKDQYTNMTVTHKNIMVEKVGKMATIDYVLDRTLMRPRDVIQFFNTCINKSDGKPTITLAALREAEGIYSRERLNALFDEWYGLYPNLSKYFHLLKGKPEIFSVSDISTNDLQENLLYIVTSGIGKLGIDYGMMLTVCNNDTSIDEYRKELISVFYKVGLIGLKIDSQSPFSWSHLGGVSVSSAEISETSKVSVQKTFHRVLGIGEKSWD